MKQPHRLTFSDMRRIATNMQKDDNGMLRITPDFGIGLEIRNMFPQLMKIEEPLLVEDSRIGVFLSGEADITINLTDHHITPHTAVYIGRGSIAQINQVSPDIRLMGMMFSDDRLGEAMHGQWPRAFNGERLHFFHSLTVDEEAVIANILQTVWSIVSQQQQNKEIVNGLIYSLLYYYDAILNNATNELKNTHSRNMQLFERFLRLVNGNGGRNRQLAFYADKMCLTERYLGTAIRNASGTTAKAWIDRATITTAKVMLRHTDKPIAAIADELLFANASFFSKYFHRLARITPGQYRNEVTRP